MVVCHSTFGGVKGDYEVLTNQWGEIGRLRCEHCGLTIDRQNFSQPRTSTSGLGRYNRMRAAMVRHLHEKHRAELGKHGE